MHGGGERANGYAARYSPPKYDQLPATTSQISSKEATECAAHSMARNAVLVLISQGTEVTIVTSTFLFDISLVLRRVSMLSMGTSPISPCYDAERLETKTHMGLGPGESKEYTKHRVSLEGHPWPGCYPVSNTWRP